MKGKHLNKRKVHPADYKMLAFHWVCFLNKFRFFLSTHFIYAPVSVVEFINIEHLVRSFLRISITWSLSKYKSAVKETLSVPIELPQTVEQF